MKPTFLHPAKTAVLGVATVVFFVLCVLPLVYMLTATLTSSGDGFGSLLLDARQRGLLANSLWLATGACIVATVLGVLTGFTLARASLRFKWLLRLALFSPLLVPPYIAALGWTYAGIDGSFAAASAILGLVFFPIVMLATEEALRSVEPRLEEAALLVTSPRRVLWRITFPLCASAIGAAALIVFVLGLSEFGVPALLRVRVFTTEIFTAFAALYDFPRAVAMTVPLLVLSVLMTIPVALIASDRLLTTRRAHAGRHLQIAGLWGRWALVFCVAVVSLALVIPVLSLLREAMQAPSIVFALEGAAPAILNSLLFSAVGASVITGLAIWLGYARARIGRMGGRLADALCIALFAAPSTVVGVGLIQLWNRPGILGAIYGTDGMLVLAYVARFLPMAVLLIATIFARLSVAQEEAAALSGAGWWRTMRSIVLPQLRRGLGLAWILLFVFVFGELGASILVVPPGEATLPIRIYTLIANTSPSSVAILALLQVAVTLAPVALMAILGRPKEA